jgi:hypothetical protein
MTAENQKTRWLPPSAPKFKTEYRTPGMYLRVGCIVLVLALNYAVVVVRLNDTIHAAIHIAQFGLTVIGLHKIALKWFSTEPQDIEELMVFVQWCVPCFAVWCTLTFDSIYLGVQWPLLLLVVGAQVGLCIYRYRQKSAVWRAEFLQTRYSRRATLHKIVKRVKG